MAEAISNTSPLLYLYRIGALDWLAKIFQDVWVPGAVTLELKEGQRKGYDVPVPSSYSWLKIVEPKFMPSEWLALDLGIGELAAMALALENPGRVVLLDDALARRTAQAAGLMVRGTLGILLEAKSHRLTERVEPWVDKLEDAGMWISGEIRQRILHLAGEGDAPAPSGKSPP
jgi:predicted nucleic acid-binding protein